MKDKKYTKLVISLILDAIGSLSYFVPGVAESIDFVWAPVSGFILTKMYKGTTGKVAGIVSLIEEISPGMDVIPTFTLTWIYAYIIAPNTSKKQKTNA